MALAVAHRHGTQHVSQRHCPERCSERGACTAPVAEVKAARLEAGGKLAGTSLPGARCVCDAHYQGAACEVHKPSHCWNDCGGPKRGSCIHNFCVCVRPFYGPGCSLVASGFNHFPHPPSPPSSRPPALRVYVYDVPPMVLARLDYASDDDPIFNTYHLFMRTLLADGAALATTPEEADLFFAPAFATNMPGLLEYYTHVQRHIASSSALWGRNGGRDHFWWGSGDGAGCDLNQLEATRSSIVVAHYLKFNTSDRRCGVRGKDVAVPPHVPAVHSAPFIAAGKTPLADRSIDFFFAGNVPDAPTVPTTPDEALQNEAYSEGVRHLVWKHLRGARRFKVVSRSASYAADWANSQFCLAPQGVGWGVRLSWAVVGGCIPVLASSEVSAWFDDAINYDAFSLRGVPKLDLPRLPSLLANVSAAERASMQRSLWQHRRFFLWPTEATPDGLAYQMTMHQLCQRAARQNRGKAAACAAILGRGAASLVRGAGRQGARSVYVEASRRGGGGRAGRGLSPA